MCEPWVGDVEQALGVGMEDLQRLSGGDFAAAYRATLSNGRHVFLKTHADPPPGFFSTEAAGLAWLVDAGTARVARVLGFSDDPPWLALEYIPLGRGPAGDEAAFGRALAGLHASGAACFGREDRRTTGSQAVPNTPCGDWPSFYAECRLQPLARRARDADALPIRCIAALERVTNTLGEVGAGDEPAARLHGDLWAGNRVVDGQGRSWLIDPAAHGGHREFDLAMMRLFGGFEAAAFDAYQEMTPLQPGWRERVPLHQLAPLVVHAIKFGGGYVGAVEEALRGLGAFAADRR